MGDSISARCLIGEFVLTCCQHTKLTESTGPAYSIFNTPVPHPDQPRIRYSSFNTRVQTTAIPAYTTGQKQILRMRLRVIGALRISQQTCDGSSRRGFHKLIEIEKSTKKRIGVMRKTRTLMFARSIPYHKQHHPYKPSFQPIFSNQEMSDISLDVKAYLDTCVEKAIEGNTDTISTDERYVLSR